jgi:hypothetical protein
MKMLKMKEDVSASDQFGTLSVLPQEIFTNEIVTKLNSFMYLPCAMVNKTWNKIFSPISIRRYVKTAVWWFASKHGGPKLLDFFKRILINKKKIDYCETLCGRMAEEGNVEVLRWLNMNTHGGLSEMAICLFAGAGSRINVLEWATPTAEKLIYAAYTASLKGHLSVLKWLEQKGLKLPVDIAVAAARGGQLDILKWMVERGMDIVSPMSLPNTCWMYYINSCKRIFLNDMNLQEPRRDYIVIQACKSGNLEMLKWLLEIGVDIVNTPDQCYHLAKKGDHESLKWLYSIGCSLNSKTLTGSIRSGNVSILSWVIDKLTLSKSFTNIHEFIHDLKKYANAEILVWIEQNQPGILPDIITVETMKLAIEDERVDVIKWLRAKGCEWYKNSMSIAVKCYGYDSAKTLLALGCPWSDAGVTVSQLHMHTFASWMLQSGFTWSIQDADALARSTEIRDMVFAIEYGCPFDRVTLFNDEHLEDWLPQFKGHTNKNYFLESYSQCDNLAETGMLGELKSAIERGGVWDRETCRKATCPKVVKYLHEIGCKCDRPDVNK